MAFNLGLEDGFGNSNDWTDAKVAIVVDAVAVNAAVREHVPSVEIIDRISRACPVTIGLT